MRPGVLSVIAVPALACVAFAQDRPPAATIADVDSAVAVFAALDLPSVAGRRHVVLNTGGVWRSGEKVAYIYASGWLLEETPEEVELLTRGLMRRRFPRATAVDPVAEQPADLPAPGQLADADFEQLVRHVMATTEPYFGFGAMDHAAEGGLSRHAEGCLFAFWARQRGRDDLASELQEFALRVVEEQRKRSGADGPPGSLAAAVTSEVAENLRWRAINAANEGEPRADLQRRWQKIATLPRNDWTDEAVAMVRAYASLVEEDAAWSEPTTDELEASPTSQRVAHWIHHLRDVAARQMMQPGSVTVLGHFSGVRDGEKNPAEELAKLGWDAVPALIESLTDDRPSRSLGYWRHFAPATFYLLTIGDCCQQVFEAITGEQIYRRLSTSGAMTKDGRAQAAQLAARTFWSRVGHLGERGFLVEAVSSGEPDAVLRAQLLLERYPDAALSAIAAGVASATTDAVRARLVLLAGGLEVADPTTLLETEAAPDRPLVVRVAAVRGLVRRGRSQAVLALIPAWRDLAKDDAGEAALALVGLLVESGEAAAVRALGEGLQHRPAAIRQAVFEALRATKEDTAGDVAWLAAIEELLIAMLADDREVRGTWSSGGRLCDLAGEHLSARWPERYRFDVTASPGERDRQRVVAQNAWRATRALPPLPVPGQVSLNPAQREAVGLALDRLLQGDGAAASELEALGPAALNDVEARLNAMAPDHPAVEPLRGLAGRLSLTALDVRISAQGADPDAAWRERLQALRGRHLNDPAVVAVLTAAADGLPSGAKGLELGFGRLAGGAGVVVTAAFLGPVEAKSRRPSWGGSPPRRPPPGRAWEEVHGTGTPATVLFQRVGGPVVAFLDPGRHAVASRALAAVAAVPRRAPFATTVRILLGDDEAPRPEAPDERRPRLDRQGRPLPAGAVSRIGSTRFRQPDAVMALAFSPDGTTIASGSHDGSVWLRDSITGELRTSFRIDSGFSEFVTFSADGRLLLAGSIHGETHVFDLEAGHSRLDLSLDLLETSGSVSDLVLLPDGASFVSINDGGRVVRRWSAVSGELLESIEVPRAGPPATSAPQRGEGLTCLALAQDGTVVLADATGGIHLWKPSVRATRPLGTIGEGVRAIAWSPDGRLVATESDRGVTLLVAANGEVERVLPVERRGMWGGGYHVAFSLDGTQVAATHPNAGKVRVWDVASGAPVRALSVEGAACTLAFAPDGKTLATGCWGENIIQSWDLASGRELYAGPASRLPGRVGALALSEDGGTLLVGTMRGQLLWLERSTAEVTRSRPAARGEVMAMALSATGGRLVTGSSDGVRMWDLALGKELWAMNELRNVSSVSISRDRGVIACATRDGAVRVWRTTETGPVEIRGLKGAPVALSPDGTLLAVGEAGEIHLLDVATGAQRRVIAGTNANMLRFSPDGETLAVGCNDGALQLWEVATGRGVRALSLDQSVRSLTFSADGALVAAGGWEGRIAVWRSDTGEELHRFVGHEQAVTGLTFTPDGRTLVSAGLDGIIYEWLVETP